MDIPIIVLAAGTSSRMGGADKLMQVVDGMPLLTRQVRLARAATQGEVIVALPAPPHPRYEAVAGLDVTICPVPDAAAGMSVSLRAALAEVPPEAKAAALVLGDLPDLTEADLKTVLKAVDPATKTRIWRGATADGKPGHPVVFHRGLFPAISRLSGDTGAQEVIRQAPEQTVLIPLPGQHARADLDTPEDWADWRAKNPAR